MKADGHQSMRNASTVPGLNHRQTARFRPLNRGQSGQNPCVIDVYQTSCSAENPVNRYRGDLNALTF